MKLSQSNKKLNININVLPDKYRWHFIKFKYIVVILLFTVAAAGVLLAYQVVVDTYAVTDGLYEESDLLTTRVSTALNVHNKRARMQKTMNEYGSLTAHNGIMRSDVMRIYEIEADHGVGVKQVDYISSEIKVIVPAFDDTAGYIWDLWIDKLGEFAGALRDDERFRSVTYEDPNFAPGEFLEVELTVGSSRLPIT